MTVDQIRPSRKPDAYRNRATGQPATVAAFSREHQMVKLATFTGPLVMVAEAFWSDWIHRDLYQTDRNCPPQPLETP